MSNSSKRTPPVGRELWEELLEGESEKSEGETSILAYYFFMFFIAYAFKGQVHVFAGQVKIVSHSSFRTSAILKYFCQKSGKMLCKLVIFSSKEYNQLTLSSEWKLVSI